MTHIIKPPHNEKPRLTYPSLNGKYAGILKKIHVPTEVGEVTVQGLCVNLLSPNSIAEQKGYVGRMMGDRPAIRVSC